MGGGNLFIPYHCYFCFQWSTSHKKQLRWIQRSVQYQQSRRSNVGNWINQWAKCKTKMISMLVLYCMSLPYGIFRHKTLPKYDGFHRNNMVRSKWNSYPEILKSVFLLTKVALSIRFTFFTFSEQIGKTVCIILCS